MKIAICNSKKWFNLSDEILLNHEILNIEHKPALSAETLATFDPDVVFFPHWNWLVDESIFSRFRCIVFHTAPLPYGRGGSPIQNLIIRGHKTSPVCALMMSDGIDNGPIYDKEIISLDGSLSEIFQRLNVAVNDLIKRLVVKLPEPTEQFGEIVTFKRLGDQDNKIALDTTIDKIYDIIRMLDDASYPSAYISLENVLLEFSEITKVDEKLYCNVCISNKGSD